VKNIEERIKTIEDRIGFCSFHSSPLIFEENMDYIQRIFTHKSPQIVGDRAYWRDKIISENYFVVNHNVEDNWALQQYFCGLLSIF